LQEFLSSSSANTSLAQISDAKRELLEKFLRGELKQQSSPRTIASRPLDAPPQLSFAQERLWFLDQLDSGSAVYNVPLAVRLSGPIDHAVIERTVNEIVGRHESLRTTFATVAGQPVVAVHPNLQVPLRTHDLQTLSAAEREPELRRLLRNENATPFDLSQGPLIRTTLIRLDEERYVFLVVMHHIVSDGWSLVIFFRELSALYQAFTRDEQSPLAENVVQYADYAAWQRDWLQGELLQKQLAYWQERLSGALPILELPADRPRPAVQTFNGAREWLSLSEELTGSLQALVQREGLTLFIALLAAFKVLLNRYSGQDDVIVGSPIANRPQTETESLIGFFLNNLPLRTDLSGNPSFRETLKRVKTTALEAYAHQDVPFEKLIGVLKPERDLSRTPVFQVYFNLFNFGADIKLPGSAATSSFVEAWGESDETLSKFDLTLYAGLHERQLKLAFVYNTDLFDAATIKLMLAHFESVLSAAVAEPEQAIADLLPADDSRARLPARRITPCNKFAEFRREEIEQSITARFASQAKQYADRLAISTRNFQWTYAELNESVDRTAGALVALRGGGAERVALLFEHDAPMVAAMLGSLKAGKTYVPLDPFQPPERLKQIIAHAGATVLLTNNKNIALARKLITNEVQLINFDCLTEKSLEDQLPEVAPDRLAYILYTSGSTGEPKGVMQNHRNVLHYIRVYTNNLHLSAADRLTLLSSYCFDASVMDIYGALLNGATLYPIAIKGDGLADLAAQLQTNQITVYHSTPTVYRYFLSDRAERCDAFPRLRLVVLGGEKVNRADVELYQRNFSADCLFVNGFGPTEATISLQNIIDQRTKMDGDSVPVGFAVDDTEVLLLNDDGRTFPVAGEIAIRSAHLALGYWRNDVATARAFSSSGPAAIRVYRTGDLGRRLPDGSIKFTGRKDFQVKLRGYRIELGEIEVALAKHPRVREGVVMAHETGADQRLIAYVVPIEKVAAAAFSSELRKFLKQKLPEYMVPNAFVMLESLPLTASGKLNRRALPAPAENETNPDHGRAASAPTTALEKMLIAIWSEVLANEALGVADNFFELGGHSLMAVRLFARIEKKLGKRLPLATLFRAPTVAQLAAVIEKDFTPAWSSLVEIQSGGTELPFFCVHAVGGNVLEYYALARHLGEDQPFYGLQSAGLNESHLAHTRVPDMAAHYLKELRELQPQGPYFIGGRSLGGIIAFEMAQQLRDEGQAVGLLALLDTYPSGYAKLSGDETGLLAALRRGVRRTKAHFANLRRLTPRLQVSYLRGKARYAPDKLKSQVWRRCYSACQKLGRPLPRLLRDVTEFNSLAGRDYVPRVYDGKITLFWASADLRTSLDLVEGWRALAGGGIEVHEISGSHLDIVKEPHVGELANKLRSVLAETRRASQYPSGGSSRPGQ
jgi:amino acid adenylation domain-containing protein